MASLVICMHIRFLLNELQKQYNKHLTYHRVVFDMECKYPQINTKGECLICWDTFRYEYLRSFLGHLKTSATQDIKDIQKRVIQKEM